MLQLTHKLGGGGVCKKRHADKGEGRGTRYHPKMMLSFMNSPDYLETLKLQKRAKTLFPLLVTKHFLVWQTKHFETLLSLQLLESWQLFSSLCFCWHLLVIHIILWHLVYFVCLIQSAILNAQSSNGTFITYYKATRPYLWAFHGCTFSERYTQSLQIRCIFFFNQFNFFFRQFRWKISPIHFVRFFSKPNVFK